MCWLGFKLELTQHKCITKEQELYIEVYKFMLCQLTSTSLNQLLHY